MLPVSELLQGRAVILGALSLLACGVGVALVLWAFFPQLAQVKVRLGKLEFENLPVLAGKLQQVIIAVIGAVLLTIGAFGSYRHILRPPLTLTVMTGLAEDELAVLSEMIRRFEKDRQVAVNIENVDWREALDRLIRGERIDLLTFDINGQRDALVAGELVQDLSEEKGLIPSSVHPALIEHVEGVAGRYFVPFRPNIRLLFLNKRKLRELYRDSTDWPSVWTWADVARAARALRDSMHQRGEARVVIEASESDAPLVLLELVRSAGGDPCNLLDDSTKSAVEFLRELWPYVSPKSLKVNWQTATGYLLSGSVYLSRNWTFSLSSMEKAGLHEDFDVHAGPRWAEGCKPYTLLGGEYFVLPKSTRHREVALDLMRFLVSRDVQLEMVRALSWPAMRLDVLGQLSDWQRRYQPQINEALLCAEPVPEWWHPNVNEIYGDLFRAITESTADIDRTLVRFQARIESLEGDECDSVVEG